MFRYAGLVDIGVHEDHNDDRALIDGRVLADGKAEGSIDSSVFHAAVCDGVGGAKQGARAAQFTAEKLGTLDAENAGIPEIKNLIEKINLELLEIQNAEGTDGELITTVAGMVANGDGLIVYNAGDSRVYRQRGRFIRLLSKDHSYVQLMVDMGKLDAGDAKFHPKRNIINKCIGYEIKAAPRVVEFDDLLAGDVIMLCSDGISDVLEDKEISEMISQHTDLAECCGALRDAAVSKGSFDNMTVLLVRKEGAE